MPYLDMVLDEVLRLYPPAWIGPRRAVREFEFGGHTVPEGAYLNYCSWASHRIPEFFPDPEAFIPERFTSERKAALPRGAYVPFGGGKRICIGKRFGQIEVKLVATMLLQRLRLDLLPGRTMTVRQMPTLSPRGGLKMLACPRMIRAVPVATEAWTAVFGGLIPVIGLAAVGYLIVRAARTGTMMRPSPGGVERLVLPEARPAASTHTPLVKVERNPLPTRPPRRYLMKSISSYFGSGQRSSATTFSSLSAASRTSAIAAICLSRA